MFYLLYLLTLCLANTVLIYLVNAVVFRVKGRTLVAYVSSKSSTYDKLRRRTSNGVVLVNTLLLLGLNYLLFWEVRSLRDMNESSVASPLLLGVVVVIAVDIVGMWITSHLNKVSDGAASAKRGKDNNEWLT